MRIEKQKIANAINLIAQTYENYRRHLAENGGIQAQTENWSDFLQVVEQDYPEANDDFVTAVKLAITENKYAPTIKEILDMMKRVRNRREQIEKTRQQYHFLNLIQEYPFYRINTGVELEEAYEIYQKKKLKDTDISKAIKNYKMVTEIRNEKPTKPINLFFKEIDNYIIGK